MHHRRERAVDRQISAYDLGRISGMHAAGLSYRDVAALTGHSATTVMRLCKRFDASARRFAREPEGGVTSLVKNKAQIDSETRHEEGVGTRADNLSANSEIQEAPGVAARAGNLSAIHDSSSEYISDNKEESTKCDKDTPV